jgi:hypothetical protein
MKFRKIEIDLNRPGHYEPGSFPSDVAEFLRENYTFHPGEGFRFITQQDEIPESYFVGPQAPTFRFEGIALWHNTQRGEILVCQNKPVATFNSFDNYPRMEEVWTTVKDAFGDIVLDKFVCDSEGGVIGVIELLPGHVGAVLDQTAKEMRNPPKKKLTYKELLAKAAEKNAKRAEQNENPHQTTSEQ